MSNEKFLNRLHNCPPTVGDITHEKCFAVAWLMVAPAVAVTEKCHTPNPAEVGALFDAWNASLQTGDPAKVAANYTLKSILLPTLSDKPRLTVDEKKDYFVHFLQKKPKGKIDSREITTGCNWAVNSGLYTFTFGDGKQVPARYTYVYQWDGKQWLIVSHHSSAMPEAGAPKSIH